MYWNKVSLELVKQYYTKLHDSLPLLIDLYHADAVVTHTEEGQQMPFVKGESAIQKYLESDALHLAGSVVAITSIKAIPSAASTIVAVVVGEVKNTQSLVRTFTQTFVLHSSKKEGTKIISDVLTLLKEENDVYVQSVPAKQNKADSAPVNVPNGPAHSRAAPSGSVSSGSTPSGPASSSTTPSGPASSGSASSGPAPGPASSGSASSGPSGGSTSKNGGTAPSSSSGSTSKSNVGSATAGSGGGSSGKTLSAQGSPSPIPTDTKAPESAASTSSSAASSQNSAPSSDNTADKEGERAKKTKTKFSADSVAKAFSFQPKNSFASSMNTAASFQPTPQAYAPMSIPAIQSNMGMPIQYPPIQHYPFFHPPVTPQLSMQQHQQHTNGFIKLSSNSVTQEQVEQTLRSMGIPYNSLSLDIPRLRGYITYQYPTQLSDAISRQHVEIVGSDGKHLTVMPRRYQGPRDYNNGFQR